jgi:taurine dioxygenase
MSFTVAPLSAGLGFGACVTALDANEIARDDVRHRLYDLWLDRGVILFRGLPDDPQTQIALSRVFGEPAVHPLKQTTGQGAIQELADIFYQPDRGDIVRFEDGQRLGAWLPWHFDLAYVDSINHGGILRPVQLPETGGATGFIDGLDAYERLPEALRGEIENAWAVYIFDGDLAGLRYGRTPGIVLERMNVGAMESMKFMADKPPVAHPLVYEQPGSGRKVLNFSPWFSVGIEGMEQAEADRILREVTRYLVDERFAYFHEWRRGDMVLWDNWRILHCARGIPLDQSRHMQRTTISGDYGLGRVADWPPSPTSLTY